MDFMEVAAKRISTRSFTSEPVSAEDLKTIIKVGCAAPVAHAGFDRLRIVVVQNQEWIAKLREEVRKVKGSKEYDFVYGAQTLVIVASRTEDGKPDTARADSANVINNMLLAATDLGIQSVFLYTPLFGLEANPELIKDLNLPEGYNPVASAAFGYASKGVPEERTLENRIGVSWFK